MDPSISLAAQICSSSVSDMPQEMARHLFETGAFLIFTNVPEGTEFGIDYKSWGVGPKFSGLKMIPPGVHFIFFSVKTAPRIGFFHCFKEHEILVRKWDPASEDMLTEPSNADEIARIRANLKNLDSRLGPYPYENYRSWFALSSYIKEKSVERLKPEDERGRITGQAELVTLESEVEANLGMSTSRVDREHPTRFRFADENGLPIMHIKQGFKIRFTQLESPLMSDSRAVESGLDHSTQLDEVIASLDGDVDELLAEIQFAFVCFLMGQVYEGFEQWKRLIHLLCSCKKAITTYPNLYISLLPTIHFQLKECPKDFFVDIVSKDNFLTTTLSRLFVNIEDSEDAPAALKEKSAKFKNFLTKHFRWNFDTWEE
uniref:Protein AAR2 homolog n=1 Tax=Ascaris lumbricoides TaxID=6252 RepID=A0A0M3HYW2_ASCLU